MAKNPFRELTDEISLPLERVADAIGRSYNTVLAYRSATRPVPPEVYDALADFIEKHQGRMPALVRLARRYGSRSS